MMENKRESEGKLRESMSKLFDHSRVEWESGYLQ
jgi:hypothetical protein